MRSVIIPVLIALSISFTMQRGLSAQQTDTEVSSGAVNV